VRLFRHILYASTATISSAMFFLILTTSLRAQELVRSSAGPPAIESFRRTPGAFFYLGPFEEELNASANVEYNDNVNLTSTDRISDLSFSLGLALSTTWVISHLNQVTFNFGGEVTENLYGNGLSQLNFSIAPDSRIEMKFEVADYQVRLYNTFSYVQNPTSNPSATNTANANNLTNTTGVSIDKDLGITVLSLSADYTYNNQGGETSNNQANPNTTGTRHTFRAGPTLTFRLSPTILYGVTTDATRSTGTGSANVNSLSFGAFINGKLTKEFEFDLAGGITLVSTKPAIPPGYYYSAALRYQVKRHFQLLFSGSHDLIFTTGTGLTEENVFRLGAELDLTRLISLSVSPFINFGDVKTTNNQGLNPTGAGVGPYTQVGLAASLSWKPRKSWSTALNYNFVRREAGATSEVTGGGSNYIQNTIGLSIGYQF
jgi:hypothetical protein